MHENTEITLCAEEMLIMVTGHAVSAAGVDNSLIFARGQHCNF